MPPRDHAGNRACAIGRNLLALISALLCFALFAFTGQAGWRQHSVSILKWTLVAAVVVGAGILIEHLLPHLNA